MPNACQYARTQLGGEEQLVAEHYDIAATMSSLHDNSVELAMLYLQAQPVYVSGSTGEAKQRISEIPA